MGFRIRKSVNLDGFRVNFAKCGIGCSLGVKGARVTKKCTGGTKVTVYIPKTGISYVKDYKD